MVSAQSAVPGMVLSKSMTGHCTSTDVELLGEYVLQRRQEAFSEIVRRHSGIVWGVCRRVLIHQQDAEDAFQATFIILARKASSLRDGRYLSTWLYSVAFHAARNVRKMKQRRLQHEAHSLIEQNVAEATNEVWSDIEPILDEELQRLPKKYQLPLVLCCIEGKTHAEAGTLLSWPIGTIAARLSRGREMLRQRLARRGVVVSSLMLTGFLTSTSLMGETPLHLLERCCIPGSLLHANTPVMQSILGQYHRQLFISKLGWGLGALLTITLATGGYVYWSRSHGESALAQLPTGPNDGAVKPNPRFITLPREPKVQVLNWKKENMVTTETEQSVTVLADGSLQLHWLDKETGKTTDRELKLPAQEWQELLQFMVHDKHFFQFDAKSEWNKLLKEYEFEGDLRDPNDVWKTAIELQLPGKKHEVEWDQLSSTEAWFHEHASIRELSALSQRMANYIVVERAGGRQAVEPICSELNRQLRPYYSHKRPFTTFDLVSYQPATDAKPAGYSFSVGCKFIEPDSYSANCIIENGKAKYTTSIPGPSEKPPRMKKREVKP
jgi:RNA polymerase sigma factor (sigma-70 family)